MICDMLKICGICVTHMFTHCRCFDALPAPCCSCFDALVNILWAYCPALAANGARPWPVHRDRLLIVTAALLLGFCQLLQADSVGASTPCTDTAKKSKDGNTGDNDAASTNDGSNTGHSSSDHSWIVASSAGNSASANSSWVDVRDALDTWHEHADSEFESESF